MGSLALMHIVTGQKVVEEGEEGEAEERGQGEGEGVGPLRHGDKRLPDCRAEHVGEAANAKG